MQHIRYRCTTAPQNFQTGDAPPEASHPQKKTHCTLLPHFRCCFAASHRSIFWQDYGGEILPTVNHLYYQLTARYDLPVSKYDFAALQEENETTFAESLSSVDADAENITEALSELVKTMQKLQIS